MGFLLELLDGTLVDTTALVDQVTGGGGLAWIRDTFRAYSPIQELYFLHFGALLQ